MMAFTGQCGRRPCDRGHTIDFAACFSARVVELSEHRAIMLMTSPRYFPVSRNASIVVGLNEMRTEAAGTVYAGNFHDDESNTAGRSGLVVGDQFIGGYISRQMCVMCGKYDSICHFEAADSKRRKELGKISHSVRWSRRLRRAASALTRQHFRAYQNARPSR